MGYVHPEHALAAQNARPGILDARLAFAACRIALFLVAILAGELRGDLIDVGL